VALPLPFLFVQHAWGENRGLCGLPKSHVIPGRSRRCFQEQDRRAAEAAPQKTPNGLSFLQNPSFRLRPSTTPSAQNASSFVPGRSLPTPSGVRSSASDALELQNCILQLARPNLRLFRLNGVCAWPCVAMAGIVGGLHLALSCV
jgi:hypothetical protein